jgi:hypothetical protein
MVPAVFTRRFGNRRSLVHFTRVCVVFPRARLTILAAGPENSNRNVQSFRRAPSAPQIRRTAAFDRFILFSFEI